MNKKNIPALDQVVPAHILLPFSKIQLIALDLDGTLLTSNNSPLPERVRALTKKLRHHNIGVQTTIATGRTLTGSKSLIEDLEIPKHIPIIVYNGTVVINNDEKIFIKKELPKDSFRNIINALRDFPIKLLAYTISKHNGEIYEVADGWTNIDRPKTDYNSMPIRWHEFNEFDLDVPPSIMVLHYRDSQLVPAITMILSKISNISHTHGASYIEICPKNSNKGKALKYVSNLLNLSNENVLAMGDNDNDAEMIKWAGIGVAVQNASNMAISKSNYVSNFGVIKGAIEVLQVVYQAKLRFSQKENTQQQFSLIPNREDNTAHHLEMFPEPFASELVDENYINLAVYNSDNRKSMALTITKLIEFGFLPKYTSNQNQQYFLSNDFHSIFNKITISEINTTRLQNKTQSYKISFAHDSYITDISDIALSNSFLYPAILNLFSAANDFEHIDSSTDYTLSYIEGTKLYTKNKFIAQYAQKQLDRLKIAELHRAEYDLPSPHYMGSKRNLCGFIVESIAPFANADTILVDLMCGSGIISGVFSRFWKTYSSDSQEFCRQLAIIHGGGFDTDKAREVISFVVSTAIDHFDKLRSFMPGILEQENEIFCSEVNHDLAKKYQDFIHSTPTISNKLSTNTWNPQKEIELRRHNVYLPPYCLFTTYFANTYFGIRQSLEIDSLRYAIDQIKDSLARDWALGTLVSTTSYVGTTYGGHFAQPKYKDITKIPIKLRKQPENTAENSINTREDQDNTAKNPLDSRKKPKDTLSKLLDTRSRSVIHDFSTRLLTFSKLSELHKQPVETVNGPWKQSLHSLSKLLNRNNVIVYLDPPYTRDEYSRYYHVLETLVKYNYPSCTGTGLTPDSSERFRTPFSTRNKNYISKLIIQIISNILDIGWTCAWSYSNTGMANIHEVLSHIIQKYRCNIKSYSTPYTHRSQGGFQYKDVVEYLIIITPM